jgi:uncharacterized membrane protein YeaQ/YmgE (transglycosylase-associated protein family)
MLVLELVVAVIVLALLAGAVAGWVMKGEKRQ